MRAYVAEALGCFILVFAGAGAIVINDQTHGVITHVGVALTFGLVVMALIYGLGEISGAHLNCAVTLAFWCARRMEGRRVAPYIVAQLVGAIAAAAVLRLMFPDHPTLGATLPVGSTLRALIMETLLTAILMLVILGVSSGPKEQGTMAAIAIGAVVALEALFAGPITGASMNPARSLGPALVSGHLHAQWVYVLGPVVGAVAVVPLHAWLRNDVR